MFSENQVYSSVIEDHIIFGIMVLEWRKNWILYSLLDNNNNNNNNNNNDVDNDNDNDDVNDNDNNIWKKYKPHYNFVNMNKLHKSNQY